MQQAFRDALIALRRPRLHSWPVSSTPSSVATAPTSAANRAARDQFNKVRAMLGQQGVGIAQIAKETGLTRQTICRIKDDPAGAEAAGCLGDVRAVCSKPASPFRAH